MRALLLAALGLASLSQADEHTSLELGLRQSGQVSDTKVTRTLTYGEGRFDLTSDLGAGQIGFKAGLRVSGDFENASRESRRAEAELRALSVAYSQGAIKAEAGFQEIPWGESFGYQVADIVNPRDWRDPLLLDSSWARLSVFALQSQVFLDRLTLQGIFVPVPRTGLLPGAGSTFDPLGAIPSSPVPVTLAEPRSFGASDIGVNSEYGGRASYLFESGLDLSFLYYHHWSRVPSYELVVDPASPTPALLTPVVDPVDSLGSTLSYSVEGWVFRADGLLHLGQPLQTSQLGSLSRDGRQLQAVAGADWTSEGGLILGGQYQSEVDFYPNTTLNLNWVSFKAAYKLFSGKLEPEVFGFFGVDNADVWVQPKLTWNVNRQWSASLRMDLVNGGASPEAGYLRGFTDQSRALLWVVLKI